MAASVKVKFIPSTVALRPGSIVYLVTRHKIVRQFTTGYKVFPSEWDKKQAKVIPHSDERTAFIQSISEKIRWDMERMKYLIGKYEQRPYDYSSDDIVAEFRRVTRENTLFIFMENIISRQKLMNHVGTAINYRAALNSFKRFRNNEDAVFDMIDQRMMENYQEYLHGIGVVPNSSSFYMRILRAVYNRAVNQDLTADKRPFRTVFTGIEKTRKRAISIDDIRRINKLNLRKNPKFEFARDIFMFLFFCRGMSFIDAAYLKKSDIHDGIITYRRHKTGQLLNIKVVSKISEILKRYATDDSQYLLPIISASCKNPRTRYESTLHRVNIHLKMIAKIIGLSIPLTTYVSRHAWATIAKSKNVPITVIADALGHDSVATTQIYLASIDASTIDKANELILRDL